MRTSILSSFIICFVAILSTSLYAAGLGIAFPYGTGTTDYDLYEADESHFGINFVFDSNVAKQSVFNYRLNFGVEFYSTEYTYDYYYYDYTESIEGMKIVTDHNFGFGVLRSRVVRLWLGPNVRVGFITGDEAGMTLGAGLTAIGLNLNFGPVFTLGLEAGYAFSADIYFDDVIYEEEYYYNDSSSSGVNSLFVFKLSILFRIHDTYDDFF